MSRKYNLAANIGINQAEKNGIPGQDDDGNGFIDDIYGYDFCTYGQSRDSRPKARLKGLSTFKI